MPSSLFQRAFAAVLLTALCPCARAALVFQNMSPGASTVERLDKFESSFSLSGGSYTNAFDLAQIDVSAVFTSPSAQALTVHGFYSRDYTRSGPPEALSDGSWSWKVRFSPREEGAWAYTLTAVDAVAGIAAWGPGAFTCASSSRKGYVRVSPMDVRYLQYDDGAQYIPIGQNIGWGGGGSSPFGGATFDYDRWVGRLAAQGGNFARYWMCPWYHSLEWQSTGLGDYSNLMSDAWRLDYDLELARSNQVMVMLCLLNHGQVSTTTDSNWDQNPYNSANGGPCATTRDFFTNPTARTYWLRHQRYCVARWGYASNLIWEMTNEIDWTDNFCDTPAVRADVETWIHDMATDLKARDPYPHLVTASFGGNQWDSVVWNDPVIDLTQVHVYNGSPALEDVVLDQVSAYRSAYPGKPVHVGEFGLDTGGTAYSTLDPGGVSLHNTVWACLFGQAMGAGASWWWDNWIEPNNLYVHYRGLSNFASALDFQNGAFVFRRPTMTTSVYSGLNLRGNLGWGIKAPANDFTVGADGILTPGLNNLSGYLYGQPFHPDLYNGPVTFHVVYPAEGAFSVNVGTLSPYPPVGLRINVDGGADKFNGTVSAATTYSVAVPAGPHILAVDSTLNDWMQVSYTFSPYVPRLKAYALQGPATVAAWITNRKYNHADLALNGPPAPVGGIIRFAGLSLNGIWGLEWWDPLTGALVASGAATSSGGQMDVDVPPTTWDKAVILRYNTVPLPTSTIPPTATPTVTPIKPDKVMVVPNLLTKEHPTAEFRVPDPATLRVNIYNLAGERVGVVQGDPGTGRCTWDSGRMADDLYLAVAEAVGSNGFKRRQILRLMVKK